MKKYILIFLIVVLAGCELTVDIKVPRDITRLTLNAEGCADSLWKAVVSLNRYILDTAEIEKVENAEIVVYEDGLPIDTLLHQKKGIYKSDTGKPVAGHSYELRVMAGNYESVSGSTDLPMPASLINGELVNSQNANNWSVVKVSAQIIDDGSVNNYYQVVVLVKNEYLNYSTGEISQNSYFSGTIENETLISPLQEGTKWAGEGFLLNDVLFSGGTGSVTFDINNISTVESVGSITVILKTLSEGEYKYLSTSVLQHSLSGNPFAQPVNVYSNIENGFGIVGAYSQTSFTHSNPRSIITSITPGTGKPGDHVIIKGDNFYTPYVEFSAASGTRFASRVKYSENEIEIIIPEEAVTGKLFVHSMGWIETADFEIAD